MLNFVSNVWHFITTDTETCPMYVGAAIKGWLMLVYHWAWAVHDKKGNILMSRNFVIKEIYEGQKALMASAYYAWKLPQYEQWIADGTVQLVTFAEAWKIWKADIENFGARAIIAHNASFDRDALRNTAKFIFGKPYRIFPSEIEVWDSMKIAKSTFGQYASYRKFCENNDYLTARGQCRFTAEVCYRYITKDTDFVEDHTALEDVKIEMAITCKGFATHKKMDRVLNNP